MADNENRLESILSRFDADWTASDEARREAKNDLFFSRVSQWDDWLSQYTTLQYRGQFDVVRPVVRKLVSEMRQNPIDVLYRPKDGASPDAADVLMGMYRTDMRHNTAKIAVNIAVREQIEAGVGAWRLVTDYEDQSPTSNNQVIRREPIHSACSHVIWDSNSKLMDKSDARHCTVIHSMSQNGWEDFAEKYDLDADDIPSFQNPNDWVFPWLTQDTIQIAEFYEVVEKKETAFIYQDPVTGEPVSYFKRDIKDVIDDLADSGFIKIAERQIKRRRVYKSIITCTAVLKDKQLIAGEHIGSLEGLSSLEGQGQALNNYYNSQQYQDLAGQARYQNLAAAEATGGLGSTATSNQLSAIAPTLGQQWLSGQMNNYQNLANIGLGALQGQANAGQTYANNMSQISQQSAALAAANANRPSAMQSAIGGGASGAIAGAGLAKLIGSSTPWGAAIGGGLGLLGSLF
ncbi:portal protein [Salmonella enterica]